MVELRVEQGGTSPVQKRNCLAAINSRTAGKTCSGNPAGCCSAPQSRCHGLTPKLKLQYARKAGDSSTWNDIEVKTQPSSRSPGRRLARVRIMGQISNNGGTSNCPRGTGFPGPQAGGSPRVNGPNKNPPPHPPITPRCIAHTPLRRSCNKKNPEEHATNEDRGAYC